jgi:hypothetical protein
MGGVFSVGVYLICGGYFLVRSFMSHFFGGRTKLPHTRMRRPDGLGEVSLSKRCLDSAESDY